MQSRVTFYVHTSTGGHIKLGSIITVKDPFAPGVLTEVAKTCDVDGWNCYVVNGKVVYDGPGFKSSDVLFFAIHHPSKIMSFSYNPEANVNDVVFPKVGGYKYVLPTHDDEVYESDEAGPAPSASGSDNDIDIVDLSTLKKSELLEMLGYDMKSKLTKNELIEIILNKKN
jgi:hypothetical protein